MRHDSNQFAELHEADAKLEQPTEHDRRKEIANAMIGYERDHHDAHRACGPRDHAGSATAD